ncbi:MAG TPA: ATP-binding protein [Methylibium sp.]|uniref:ATP-binding protein n=1 Tax=Methylibium sp. TaxID=2067992 RepID=UPI002DBD0A15|nr:ATP-binding protein [Methylibium sp.]HEU4460850.1 ATP-binding protein [Methylibium sp.]
MSWPGFLRRSLRAKITALVIMTTLAALLLMATALITYATRDYRQSHLADVRTQAQVLARAGAAALAFKDRKEALQNLAVLRARSDILQAALYDADGSLFAAYSREGTPTVPDSGLAPQHRFDGDRLRLLEQVREGGQTLGTVYLESEHRLRERLTAYVLILCVVMAVALAAALGLSAWLQGVITAPILDVSRAAKAVVKDHDFSVRVAKTSDDEIGALTAGFNQMLEEIDRQTKALVESEQRFRTVADSAPVLIWLNDQTGAAFVNRAYLEFLGVRSQVDVKGYDWTQYVHPDDRNGYVDAWRRCASERQIFDEEFRFRRHDGEYRWMRSVAVPRLTAEGQWLGHTGCTFEVHDTRMAADALREADRHKDEFLATLAHELRNPLAPIRNAVQLLALNGDVQHMPALLTMLERQVTHMVRLVDDLLDVSRVSRGTIELRQERLDLTALIRTTIETSRPLIDAAEHQLELVMPEEPFHVHGDAVRLTQVFTNLLNNAARYTDKGGRIEVTAWRDGNQAAVSVRDNGIGLAPDQLPRLFKMFSQLAGRTAHAQGGLGIGLSLADRLVRMHGGSIRAESEGLGKGSCFTVWLPLSAHAGTEPSREAPLAAPKASARRRVLVVDDNRDAADSLALLLGVLDAHVDVAHGGAAALDAFERFKPEVVMLDLGMPGIDGFEVARRLRQRTDGQAITLVALTGWGQAEDRAQTRAAGFDHHLVKPADMEALRTVLQAV